MRSTALSDLADQQTMATFQNVFTRKDINARGEEIRLWHKVGLIKETPGGGRYLQLFQQPETDFYIFPDDQPDELPVVE